MRFKLPDGHVLDGRAREALQMSERMPQFLKRVLAIIGRFVYHSHRWLIVYSPTGGPPAADRVGHITYRVATSADLDRLEELERYGRGATQRHYVEEGQRLAVPGVPR